ALTQDTTHALAGVEHGTGRLAHHPLRQVAVVWQRDHTARVGGDVLGQAPHAGTGQNDDPLPLMERIRAAFHNHTGTLVAWPADLQRVMILGVPRPIPMPNVAAADRHPLQLDEALTILNGR